MHLCALSWVGVVCFQGEAERPWTLAAPVELGHPLPVVLRAEAGAAADAGARQGGAGVGAVSPKQGTALTCVKSRWKQS